MAAPASKTLKDLNGKWLMNKSKSSDAEPALALQGVSWMTRKAIGMATVTLHVTQYEGPPSPPSDAAAPVMHIDIQQVVTGGVKGTTENRCLDDMFREHSDWLFGSVKGRTRWVSPADVDDAFLREGFLEDEAEKSGPGGETHACSYVESMDNGWTATQIWGFKIVDGERRYCRNIVVAKAGERVELKLVYDYLGN
jgi:hypothetical protein